MPTSKTCFKVVLASPGDVSDERDIVSKVIAEINAVNKTHNIGLDLYQWDIDAHSGFHLSGPQGIIDTALGIEDADILIGIFYLRFGTPVPDAGSGTEHEIKLAIRSWDEKKTPEIKLYFKNASHNPYTIDSDQFNRVKEFRSSLLNKALIKDFSSEKEFEDSIRHDLLSYIDNKKTYGPSATAQGPHATQTQTNAYPKPSKIFTGRTKELADFKAIFESSNIIAIEGIGGTGKTEFSAKCIEDFIEDKSRLVWFVCQSGSKIDTLIEKAGFPDALKGENKTELAKYSGFTDLIERHKKIIFIDNFQDADASYIDFLHFAEKYLESSKIIQISREHPSSLKLKVIKLEGLKDDSLEYAKKTITEFFPDIKIDDKRLRDICDKVGGHPFAIELVLKLLNYGESPEAIINRLYTEDFEELSRRLLEVFFNHPNTTSEEKRFLLDFSILRGSITRECINEVSSGDARILRKLIDKLMITYAGGLYETHPLIREFCYALNNEREQTHLKAAEFYKKGRTSKFDPDLNEEILYHLLMAEAFEPAAELVCETGEEFILKGHINILLEIIEKLKNGFERPLFNIFLGDIYTRMGELDKALSLYEKAFSNDDEKVSAEGYIKYGETLYRKGLAKESLQYFKDACKICEKINFPKCEARSLNNIGLAQYFLGNPDALKILYDALYTREAIGDASGIAGSLNNIGLVLKEKGDLKGALEKYHESLKITQTIGDKSGIARSINNIGSVLQAKGDLKGALEKYHESLKITQEIGDKSGIASSFNNIGSVLKANGDLKGALEKFNETLKIELEIGDKSGIANSINNIGSVLQAKDDLKGALEKFDESLKIRQEIGDKSGIASSLNNIGSILKANGDLEGAIEKYHESLKIEQEKDDKSGIARSLNNIGSILKAKGDLKGALEKYHKDALEKFNESLKIELEIGGKSGTARSLNNIGSILQAKGDLEGALEKYRESLKIEQEIGGKSGIATSLHNIGTCYYEKGEKAKGLECFFRSLALTNQIGMKTDAQLGYILSLKKEGFQNFKQLAEKAYDSLDDESKTYIHIEELTKENTIRNKDKTGRNEPCPCGSGKKYKKCCWV